MYRVQPTGPSWPAVAGQVERRVMRALSATFSERSLLHHPLAGTMASCCVECCQSAGRRRPSCLELRHTTHDLWPTKQDARSDAQDLATVFCLRSAPMRRKPSGSTPEADKPCAGTPGEARDPRKAKVGERTAAGQAARADAHGREGKTKVEKCFHAACLMLRSLPDHARPI